MLSCRAMHRHSHLPIRCNAASLQRQQMCPVRNSARLTTLLACLAASGAQVEAACQQRPAVRLLSRTMIPRAVCGRCRAQQTQWSSGCSKVGAAGHWAERNQQLRQLPQVNAGSMHTGPAEAGSTPEQSHLPAARMATAISTHDARAANAPLVEQGMAQARRVGWQPLPWRTCKNRCIQNESLGQGRSAKAAACWRWRKGSAVEQACPSGVPEVVAVDSDRSTQQGHQLKPKSQACTSIPLACG